MSACRVCGAGCDDGWSLCYQHYDEWRGSTEQRRASHWESSYLFAACPPEYASRALRAVDVALMDFINRARAERANGGKHV